MLKKGDRWTVKAAGPTTSIREEPYQADVIKRYGVRAVIGKGGMGPKTLAALKESGAVYLNGIGGAAQYYARTIEEVLGVNLMEFGIPEAMWHLRGEGLRGDRHDGRARQQPARRMWSRRAVRRWKHCRVCDVVGLLKGEQADPAPPYAATSDILRSTHRSCLLLAERR